MRFETGSFRNKFACLALAAAFVLASVPASAGTITGGYFPGLPAATLPLTGLEQVPADTNLSGGQTPQTELISVSQLLYGAGVQFNTATNTSAFTATVAQTVGATNVVLALTGTLGAGAALTTPTAAQIVTALGSGVFVGQSYIIRFINSSSGAFAWTITAGTGVTVTGTATVAQNTYREYKVTVTAIGTPAVTFQNIGAGTN